MDKTRKRSSFLLLVFVLLALPLSIPQAHATGITFKSFCDAGAGVSVTTLSCTLTGVAASDTIIVNIFGLGVFNSFTTTDSQTNTYTNKIFSLTGNGAGASTYIYATLAAASPGSDVITVTTGGATRTYTFAASDYSGVTGFGQTGSDQQDTAGNTGTSTVTLTGTGSTSAFIDDMALSNSVITLTTNNAQTIRDSPTNGGNAPCNGACKAADTTSPILGWSWSGGSGCGCFASHSVLELTGGPGGPLNTIFQCYGNCGNPPITLVNTNSTHTVNFNQTITLFYEFQSNLNGFLLNVTTSMAKSYVGGVNGPGFGVYTISSCPQGVTPFSPQCPGLLQQQSGGQNFFAPAKGKISFSGLKIAVATGQWVGIALSAQFSGLDVNDTNTGVTLFQTNEGKIPSLIQAPANLGSSKMGLWAWISGNGVVGQGPSSPPSGACGPGLDFLLACVVNSSCTVVTSACQTGASVFWIIILTVITLMVTLMGFSYAMPSVNISTRGIGEFAVLIFIGWFVAFASFGLLLPYMIILMFFVIAWLFLGRARGTGPI